MGSPSASTLPTDLPFVYVDDVESPRLDSEQEAHLRRSLRCREGDRIVVCDGSGRWRTAVLADPPRPEGETVGCDPPDKTLTVAFAAPKGERLDWAVQKLTEIGVDRITIVEFDRSVVRWDPERAGRRVERLRRVARAAGEQARRVRLPAIDGPVLVDELGEESGFGPDAMVAHPAGTPVGEWLGGDGMGSCLLVGPEGGFSEREENLLGDRSFVRLAETVLRTETAAVAAGLALVWHWRLMQL
ncbi:MAG: ribosomal RNA small subunit methyltransferase E [Acidimicrobiales bacterium]|nr:MAG: ribosomal RNA small subunit methyltransferase E [Acidimicrobiales bacterium]